MGTETATAKTIIWFHNGDRVMLTHDHPDNNEDLVYGDTGTVVRDKGHEEDNEEYWVSVRWDKKLGRGHDCNRPNLCNYGYGWNVDRDYITLLDSCSDEGTEYDVEPEYDLSFIIG